MCLRIADGCVVGSALKIDGDTWNAVDPTAPRTSWTGPEPRAHGHAAMILKPFDADDPGLSGHEERVAKLIRARLSAMGLRSRTDRLGNVIATLRGDDPAPSVMLFTHMDQLGFIVRKSSRMGSSGLSALAACRSARWRPTGVCCASVKAGTCQAIITNKAHHATTPEEKYKVVRRAGPGSTTGWFQARRCEAAGVRSEPRWSISRVSSRLAGDRSAGTSVDDRAGCAVQLSRAALGQRSGGPTVHVVFSVQEEFNLRGAVVAAQNLKPDIAIQIDLMLATDTPDMADRGDMHLGRRAGHQPLFVSRTRHAQRRDPASGDGAAVRRETAAARGCRCSARRRSAC
jgi:putative aminopeptidase FrvX